MFRMISSIAGSRSPKARVLVMTLVIALVWAAVAYANDHVENPTIVASEDGITLPEGLVSGINVITLQNDSEIDFNPAIGRFIDDKTLEDFTAAMMAQDKAEAAMQEKMKSLTGGLQLLGARFPTNDSGDTPVTQKA